MLFLHWLRRAASRACWTAGNRSAIKIAMMAMTTQQLDQREGTPWAEMRVHDDLLLSADEKDGLLC